MRRIVWTSLSCLLVAVAVAACGAGSGARPTDEASPSSAASARPATASDGSAATSPGRATRPFGLLRLPDSAQVAFTRDGIVWRLPPQEASQAGPVPLTPFFRFDVSTGSIGPDPWLTALLGHRRFDRWILAGDAVAWVDSTRRVSGANGVVMSAAQVQTARRPSTTGRPLMRTSWRLVDQSGGDYDAGTRLSAFDGRLCAFWSLDSPRTGSWTTKHSGPCRGLWLVDLETGARRRLVRDGRSGADVLAMAGATAFWAPNQESASNGGSRVFHVSSTVASEAAGTFLAPVRVAGPAAADQGTFAFNALPPDSTDWVGVHVWAYAYGNGKFWQLSDAPEGQMVEAVADDFVVWIDYRRWTPGHPVVELRGTDMRSSRRPFTITSYRGDFADVAMTGDEVFWTVEGSKAKTVCGTRLVRADDGTRVRVEPL